MGHIWLEVSHRVHSPARHWRFQATPSNDGIAVTLPGEISNWLPLQPVTFLIENCPELFHICASSQIALLQNCQFHGISFSTLKLILSCIDDKNIFPFGIVFVFLGTVLRSRVGQVPSHPWSFTALTATRAVPALNPLGVLACSIEVTLGRVMW